MSVVNFVSSGNHEQDEEEAIRINRSIELRAANRCPNSWINEKCGEMVIDSPTERHCPNCNYFDYSRHGLDAKG